MPGPSLPATRPAKRRKTAPTANPVSQIETLEHQLTTALDKNISLNPLADLILLATETINPHATHKAIYALHRVISLIITSGKLRGASKTETEESKVVRAWLSERLGEYVDTLCGLLQDDQKALRTAALQILMSLLKHLSTSLSTSAKHPQMHVLHLRKIVNALLICPPSPRAPVDNEGLVEDDVRDTFINTWLSVHDDIRWFFLRESTALLQSADQLSAHPQIPENLLSFLERLTTMPTEAAELNAFWVAEFAAPPPWSKKAKEQEKSIADDEGVPEEDDWRTYFDDPAPSPEEEKMHVGRVYKLSTHHSLHSLTSHRAQFSFCWLALLPTLSGQALAARALTVFHRGVMPHMTKAIQLMDWISRSVDYGGSVGLLALNSLYQLMMEYNLDYPDFYKRLYAFLTRDVLHLKHRARFFRLAEIFLASTHLPATLLASFIKRLSRLSLSAPPAAIVMLIPFVYNIMKRHPSLMVMIHNPDFEESDDPFDPLEPSPLLTNALSSSLWELVSHTRHYLAPVSTLAKIFSEAFTKPSYAMEDFLDHTYTTLFETEAKRKIKIDPALALTLPVVLFPKRSGTEESADADGDVVSELWSF